ncbi:MAG: helix-turn-helix domain-containing protein [Fibromonadales bacterium]|nr:helix-turn-helix domain-containing protein [Fibromonadales bacterium]
MKKSSSSKEYSRIDMARFLKRKGLTQQELADRIDCSLGLIGGWSSYRGVPSYDKCIKLLQAGMTVAELFGEDVAKEAKLFPISIDDDFEARVGEAVVSWFTKRIAAQEVSALPVNEKA